MINYGILSTVIASYKKYFPSHWKDEKYKWEAVKCFQDNWEINAPDFAAMFEKATEKTGNLLNSSYFYPKSVIKDFAKADVEATRAMFLNLYDESLDLAERVESFMETAETMRSKYGGDNWNSHYQNTNAISVYLWLRYPEKYYIYKYKECLSVAKTLESDFIPKKTSSADSMIGGYRLYDEICNKVEQDTELWNLFNSLVTNSCYTDYSFKTITIDIGFFISRFFQKEKKPDREEWFPAEEQLEEQWNFSIDDWISLLQDKEVFAADSLAIMKRIKDYGGQATCTQLSVKYGEERDFYERGSFALARRIAEKMGCSIKEEEQTEFRWWMILYAGRRTENGAEDDYIWKLRNELSDALDRVDLSDVLLYAKADESGNRHGYWWLNANPKMWSFSNIRIGEEEGYTLYNDNGNKRRIYQNFLDAKSGDAVIGYESYPVKQVVALAKVSREQDGQNLYFEKVEDLSVPIDYQVLKDCSELEKMEYFVNAQGSLFKLTKGEYEFILSKIRETNPAISSLKKTESYTREDFLKQVYMSEEQLDRLISLLKNKKNLILQGAPGVGKTFTAKRLAYVMMGEKDDSRIEFIQFHQNYSYEDFIMGYKPDEGSFKLKSGIFYQFCQKAEREPDKDYFFIIDEINRGNMSKIFGELLMLIEKNYRGTKATLVYSGKAFCVPPNLYIIGMMNMADRSLAMIDYALRRRFGFYEMEPGFHSDGFRAYQDGLNNKTFNRLIELIKELNYEIDTDDSLGTGFRIGHSYFCDQDSGTDEWMKEVVYYDIIPMLREYWFDDKEKLQRWEKKLTGVFHD